MPEESSQPKYFFEIFFLQILRVLQFEVSLIFWDEQIDIPIFLNYEKLGSTLFQNVLIIFKLKNTQQSSCSGIHQSEYIVPCGEIDLIIAYILHSTDHSDFIVAGDVFTFEQLVGVDCREADS